MPAWIRAVLSRVALVLVGLCLAALALELVLQVGALTARSLGHSSEISRLADRRAWIAMGDSNTYGLYVEREQAYPSVLEKLWMENPALAPIQVLNLGFPGTNSTTLLNNFERLVRSLSPERVLVLVGANDLWTVHEPSADSRVGAPARSSAIERFAWRWSRLYRLGFMLHTARSVPALEEEFSPERPLGFETRKFEMEVGGADITVGFENDGTQRSDWDRILRSNLDSLQRLAQDMEIELTLLTYPSEQHNYRRTNAVIRDWARRAGIDLIDLGAAFLTVCPEGKCEELLSDQHPSAAGYALAAQLIFDALLADRSGSVEKGPNR